MATINPQERLRHFLDSVEDYERFEAALPLSRRFNELDRPELEIWLVVAHAMMLRKYFSGNHDDANNGDDLALQKVMTALQSAVIDPAVDWQSVIANVRRVSGGAMYIVGKTATDENAVMEDHLYSRYLHGDIKRRPTVKKTVSHADHAMWLATIGRRDRMMKAAELVRHYVRSGDLVLR